MFTTSLFLQAFFLTECVEIPVVALLVLFAFRLPIRWPKVVVVSFLASALTLPYFWFLLPSFVSAQWYVPIGESLVFAVEAFLYYSLLEVKISTAVILSLVANLLSFLAGRLILG